ncbi:MAG: AarF/UbiB family protein, partial [Paracoccaceae bacterium]|nr:AarF/UbiB family protein [Paracoccaceae bacterium]
MSQHDQDHDAIALPGGRIGRLLRLGGMTSGLVGDMAAAGLRQLAQGQRPRMQQMILTPQTATRVTRDLRVMRGAAMKLGQMLSMDPGLVLPPEMTTILAALRDEAHHMPPAQLRDVLDAQWGRDWRRRFSRFDVRPFAAASIGQVHRAQTRDGRDLAIKVQYPGVRTSIDSDIDNVSTLLRLPGLLPREMDLAPMLREAKLQLHR